MYMNGKHQKGLRGYGGGAYYRFDRSPGLAVIEVVAPVIGIAERIFGGRRARAGGPDPCGYCEGQETFRGVLVKNAGKNGAPPDFRNLPPCPDATVPCGGGIDVPGLGPVSRTANKDDALDCVPQPWGGKYWLLDPCTQMWIDVTPGAFTAAPPVVPGVPPAPPVVPPATPVYPTAPNGVTIAPNGAQPQPAPNGIAKLLPIGIAAAVALMAS